MSNRIVVANDGRGSLKGISDVQQLPTVQELSVGKMNVRESHIPNCTICATRGGTRLGIGDAGRRSA